MKRQAEAGVHMGWPCCAVGMHSALELAIGLPSRSISASWMLALLMPPEVSRSFTMSFLRGCFTSESPSRYRLVLQSGVGHSDQVIKDLWSNCQILGI